MIMSGTLRMKSSDTTPIITSLSLEMCTFFSSYYMVFFFIINTALLTFKAAEYYYPSSQLVWDIVNCLMYVFLDGMCLFQFSKGNSKADIESLFWGLVFCVPLLAYHGYCLDLQTYVTRVDVFINSAAIFFVCSEFLLGFITLGFCYLRSVTY